MDSRFHVLHVLPGGADVMDCPRHVQAHTPTVLLPPDSRHTAPDQAEQGGRAPCEPDQSGAREERSGRRGTARRSAASQLRSAPTDGTTVTVQDTLPAGLSVAGITGNGWSCTRCTLTCTRSSVLVFVPRRYRLTSCADISGAATPTECASPWGLLSGQEPGGDVVSSVDCRTAVRADCGVLDASGRTTSRRLPLQRVRRRTGALHPVPA